MSLKPAARGHVVELSDDEGCHLAAGTGGGQLDLDNSRVSAMYLQRHGDEIHQALDVRVNPTIYSEERGQVEVLRLPNVKAALEWYRKQHNDVPFDVFNCSWEDLFSQMARAQGDHEARIGRKNGTNWFKYLWRKAGTKSEAIEPWLHLIPDEYGLSLVRGAIGIVFHMAEKAHEKEKAILEGFETITDTIRNAMNKGASFHSEPEMHACCQALYDCLVDGIADLIWSLKPETKGKNFIEKLKSKQEKQKTIDIQGMLKKVQRKSDELDQCAERIMARKTTEIQNGVEHLQVEAAVTRSIVTDVHQGQELLMAIAKETSSGVQYLGAAASSVLQTLAEENRYLRKQLSNKTHDQTREATESQNAVIHLLADTVIKFSRFQERLLERQESLREDHTALVRDVHNVRRSLTPTPPDSSYHPPSLKAQAESYDDRDQDTRRESGQRATTETKRQPPPPTPLMMTPKELIDDLDIPIGMIYDDFGHAARSASTFNRRTHEQAQSLVASEEFKRWYMEQRSDVLFVDGNDASYATSFITPMSLMCSSLTTSFRQALGDEAWCLNFFCGLHIRKSSDSPELFSAVGPVGMMRSLVEQLVALLIKYDVDRTYEFDKDKDKGFGRNFRENLRDGEIPELYRAFRRLLGYVPRGVTVFCFIDGVSWFESEEFEEKMEYVVSELIDLVEHAPARLKLLLTCPSRSLYITSRAKRTELIYPDQHLILGTDRRGGRGYISDRSVSSQVTRW